MKAYWDDVEQQYGIFSIDDIAAAEAEEDAHVHPMEIVELRQWRDAAFAGDAPDTSLARSVRPGRGPRKARRRE